jgi:hypothetical protein
LLGFAIQPLEENMQNDPTTLKKTVATWTLVVLHSAEINC